MGMYTNVTDSAVKVRSVARLKAWMESADVPYYIPGEERSNYGVQKEYFCTQLEQDNRMGELNDGDLLSVNSTFYGKIIGYWYAAWILVVRDFAEFVDGYVDLVYETGTDWVRLEFMNGELLAKNGELVWDDRAEQLDELHGLKSLPMKELLARRL